MTLLRCRRLGDSEWTLISIDGPAEHIAFGACGAGLSSGSLAVQYKDSSDDSWVDISELEFFDMNSPEDE